jgi:Asp-tRNA(Asn)/Glu-tRNA(Gln) amidotransferase A subunit family amidase
MHTSYKHFIIISAIMLVACTEKIQEEAKVYPSKAIEAYYDLAFSNAEHDSLIGNLENFQKSYEALHAVSINNAVAPALHFNPLPQGFEINNKQLPIDFGIDTRVTLPENKAELAFYPVYKLAGLIQSKKISSVELTQLFIDRLKTYADTLQCMITLMEDEAMKAARKADQELASGKYRGPLHGIPYGVKDLLAVEGTLTTWGAMPFKDQEINETATVVKKLNDAGAVLLAKFTLGALAMGDIWYGGVTKNPWNLEQGSSGSSAGSASATAAGLIPFAIGTETLGSIVSPSTRCGTTGLRPTFGRVSRHGAMALSWSMDKIGPICRNAWDAAIVFDAIRGEDGFDKTIRNAAFNYSTQSDIKKLKVGYVKKYFEADYPNKEFDNNTLEVLRTLGVELNEVEMPEELPVRAMLIILQSEAAAAFDELTRSGRDSLLVNQRKNAWPNSFRASRFIPAVEYINANRVRQMLIEAYHEKLKEYDVIITPSYGGSQLLITNLTGHPCVVMPNGFNVNGSPVSVSFLGKLFGEAAVLQLARAYQQATDFEDQHPEMFLK